MSPKSSSSALMSRSASARIVPSSIGISYERPVRLSVMLSVSVEFATPAAPSALCCSVAMASSWPPRPGGEPGRAVAGARRSARSGGDDGGRHGGEHEHRADRHHARAAPRGAREGRRGTEPDERDDDRPYREQPAEDVEE